jgi:hypothetical protein
MNSTSKVDVHPGLGPRRLAVPGHLVLRVGNRPPRCSWPLPLRTRKILPIYYAALRV